MGNAQHFRIDFENHTRYNLKDRKLVYSGQGFNSFPPSSIQSGGTGYCSGNGNVFGGDYQVFIEYSAYTKYTDTYAGYIKLRVIPTGVRVVEDTIGAGWRRRGRMTGGTFTFGNEDRSREFARNKRDNKEKWDNKVQKYNRKIAQANTELRDYNTRLARRAKEAAALTQKIADDEKTLEAANQGRPSGIPADMKRVVVLGVSGAGKSTFCNRLFAHADDDVFTTSAASAGCTTICMEHVRTADNPVSVIDTPGLYDPNVAVTDEEILVKILEYLKGCGGVNRFLLIFHASRARLLRSHQLVLEYFEEYFGGANFANYLTLVFTHANESSKRRVLEKEREKKEAIVAEVRRRLRNSSIPVFETGCLDEDDDDDYASVFNGFLNTNVSKSRFSCDHLRSPLDALNRTKIQLDWEISHAKERISFWQTRRREKQEKLENAQLRVRNLEEELRDCYSD